MFGLFKRSSSQLDEFKYQMLAVLAVSHAGTAMAMFGPVRPSESTKRKVFLEALAFQACLIEMRAQTHYKFTNPQQILELLVALQNQFSSLPPSNAEFDGEKVSITHSLLAEAGDEAFLETMAHYAGRDYSGLRIMDETFEKFCRVTRQSPAILKGASTNMAAMMFQIRIAGILFDGEPTGSQLEAFLRATYEFKQFTEGKIDRLLKRKCAENEAF